MRSYALVLLLALVGCHEQAPKERAKLTIPVKQKALTGQALLDELKKGGYVLYFRHFHTDHTKWDEDPIKPKHGEMTVKDFITSCDQQRPLTDFGRRRARDIGTFIREDRIPVGRVQSSPYCRALESATLLAGRSPDDTLYALVNPGGTRTFEMMANDVRPLLARIPDAGTNTIIVGHRPAMDDIRFIEEGECYVFKPLGDGRFSLAATIYDSDWYEAKFNVAYLGLRGRQPGGDEPPRGVTK